MKFIILLTLIGVAGLCYYGGTSGPESTLSGMVGCLNEMTDILETVKDKEAAFKALPGLQELAKEMQAASVGMAKSISEANPQEMQDVIVKYQKPIDDANRRFTTEVMRVCSIPGVGVEYQQLFAFSNSGSSRST